MNRPGRVVSIAALFLIVSAGSAEAQLPERLQTWLRPLPSCRTFICIFRNIPSRPLPSVPVPPQVPVGNTGPITTTPEPLTMTLLGTGLAGIGLAARRRKRENGDLA